MKRVILLIIMCVICVCSCGKKPNKTEDLDEISEILDEGGINVEIRDDVNLDENENLVRLSSESNKVNLKNPVLWVKMINQSGDEILTGEEYQVEVMENGNWEKVQIDNSYEDIGYILKQDGDRDFNISLAGICEPGTYRVLKHYYVNSKGKEDLKNTVSFVFQLEK